MQLTSTAFAEGQPIPQRYTGDGEDVSPPLAWTDPPPETRSFALICDDPDAPRKTWIHWVIFNIPADHRELPQGVPPRAALDETIKQGKNDFGNHGYGGPAPPPGKPHRYFFKLYALDRGVELPIDATKQQLLDACKDHVLAEARLMGTYQR